MKRRRFLTVTGVAILGSGCIGSLAENAQKTRTTEKDVLEYPCPPYSIEANQVVCSQTVDPEDALIYLLPSEATTSGETVEFTLHNHSSRPLKFNPHSWEIRSRERDRWREVEEKVSVDGVLELDSGAEESWSLTEILNDVDPNRQLDRGTHAVQLRVPDPRDGNGSLACIAVFQLDSGF
jgi:hypothetical protein